MREVLLPSGTVTLMLADIEGSTRLWESHSELMTAAMKRLDGLIEEVVVRHHGVTPIEQGEGDSFVAAFSRASKAVACALALQSAVFQHDWGEAPIRLRMAMHTGEVELREKSRYGGSTIGRCARLRDIAHGGQTLLSGSTYDLVAERLPEGASVKDLGTHRLRDLSRHERVYQLLHPALPEDFPPLKSLEVLPNNLPVQLTSFIGREREIDEVKGLLGETRMLTITGSGGCGKTRLAIQVAAEVLDEYEEGVWLVDLASVRDPSLVPATIASTLGMKEQTQVEPIQNLIEHLKSRRSLIIVDNCEHLITACAELSDSVLKQCPPVTLVATSREPLGILGETTWRVPSLSLPDETDPPQPEALSEYEAVRLFVDRAVKSRPNFKVTGENASAIAEICLRLDGIPLAIELAAARVKLLTPHQISEGLADRFHLLTGGGRTVMPRQQTLQASVDWSYDLLSPAERTVLQNLAVFSGGFTLDAAEAVGPGEDIQPPELLDLLERLVDKSLVSVDEAEETEARYHLLETIRQYAMERLVEAGRVKEVRTRHMEYFLGLGKELLEDLAALVTGAPRSTLPEVDNFRAATRWALAGEDHGIQVRLATHLAWILITLGQRWEGASLLEQVLKSGESAPADVRSRAWNARGWTVLWFDAGRTALECGERALHLAEQAGDERLVEATRVLIAQAAISARDLARLESVVADMQRSARPGSFEHIFAVSVLATNLIHAGELERAKAMFEEAIELSRNAGIPAMLSNSQLHLGLVSLRLGDLGLTQQSTEESIETDWLIGARDPRAPLTLGTVFLYRGDYTEAKKSFQEALALTRSQQLPNIEAIVFAHLALAFLVDEDLDAASEHAQRFESLTKSLTDDPIVGLSFGLWADLYRASGNHAKGLARLRAIRETSARPSEDLLVAVATQQEAKCLRDQGPLEQADSLAHEALLMFHRFGARLGLIESLELAAGLATDQESFGEAARLFGASDAARQEVGYVRFRIDQPRYESDLVRLREGLGEGFEAAWAEGAQMGLDEAVAYATRGRGERKRPSLGWGALTPTELRVAALVAEGLSNPQIAERMFISRHTVATHLKSIFSKLGFSSRAELAGEMARRRVRS